MKSVKPSLKTGFSFGLTSGVITTLGLMVGLHSGIHSQIAVIGGILTIAIADAFSDALGIHVSEEARDGKGEKHIWKAPLATLLTKPLFALTFILPVLLLSLSRAIIVSVIWGLLLLGFQFYYWQTTEGTAPESSFGAFGDCLIGDCNHPFFGRMDRKRFCLKTKTR